VSSRPPSGDVDSRGLGAEGASDKRRGFGLPLDPETV
jgi:hypothetical protein